MNLAASARVTDLSGSQPLPVPFVISKATKMLASFHPSDAFKSENLVSNSPLTLSSNLYALQSLMP